MQVYVSVHGEERCRKRLGVARRGVQRLVDRAWERGVPVNRAAGVADPESTIKLYANARFIFRCECGSLPVLVTVLTAKDLDEETARHAALAERGLHVAARRRRIKQRAKDGGWRHGL